MGKKTLNGELKIEKNVPIPARAYNSRRRELSFAALKKLDVGDSVVLPVSRGSAYVFVALTIGKTNARLSKDGDGWRVWRIS